MTIAEMARQMKVSRNTIYVKLKEAGVDVDTLKEAGNQLTQQGQSVIAALFDGKKNDKEESVSEYTETLDVSRTEETKREKTEMTYNVTREQLETAVKLARIEAEVEALRNENTTLRGEIAFLKEQLSIAQENTRRLLPAAEADVGIFQRLFGRRRHTVTGDTSRTDDK